MADTMTLIEKTVFLSTLEMLTKAPTEALAQLAAAAAEVQAAPGEMLVKDGDEHRGIWIVVEGRLEQRRGDGVSRAFGPLDTVGEFFLEDAPPFTLVAREESRVLHFQQEDVLDVGYEYPEFGLAVLRVHARRVRELGERMLELESRLARGEEMPTEAASRRRA
jgi:CRP-like cAMP-binding protein